MLFLSWFIFSISITRNGGQSTQFLLRGLRYFLSLSLFLSHIFNSIANTEIQIVILSSEWEELTTATYDDDAGNFCSFHRPQCTHCSNFVFVCVCVFHGSFQPTSAYTTPTPSWPNRAGISINLCCRFVYSQMKRNETDKKRKTEKRSRAFIRCYLRVVNRNAVRWNSKNMWTKLLPKKKKKKNSIIPPVCLYTCRVSLCSRST